MIRSTASVIHVAILVLSFTLLNACGGGGGDDGRYEYRIALTGLADSTMVTGHYEGWVVVNGEAFSTGKFIIDGTTPNLVVRHPENRGIVYGDVNAASFGPASTLFGESFPFLSDGSHIFITLEPEGDTDRLPSCQVILAGAIQDERANLTVAGVTVPIGFPCSVDDGSGMATLGLGNLNQATGTFQFLSPTDDDVSVPASLTNDFAGVWFVTEGTVTDSEAGSTGIDGPPPSSKIASLDLPALPGSYRYEAWAMINGVQTSLGKFSSVNGPDEDYMTAPQRGDVAPGFPFPGQDFVVSRPTPMAPFDFNPPVLDLSRDLDFPAVGDFRCFVTVEPHPDNDVSPFGVELLSAVIPPTAVTELSTNPLVVQGGLDQNMTSLFGSLPAADFVMSPSFVHLNNTILAELSASNGRRGHYELWAQISGVPRSLGRIFVSGGNLISKDSMMTYGPLVGPAVFNATTSGQAGPFPDPTLASELFLTFEPELDDDGSPSVHILMAGNSNGSNGSMTAVGNTPVGGRGLGDFGFMAGTYQLVTPTNNLSGVAEDDQFGILFRRNNQFVGDETGLDLPILPEGWRYESWIQERLTGRNFSCGKFRDPRTSDFNDATLASQGMEVKPASPGQDFLFAVPVAALMAIQGPGEISEVFITVESHPDNSLLPSKLRVLEAVLTVPVDGLPSQDVPLSLPAVPAAISATMSFQAQD